MSRYSYGPTKAELRRREAEEARRVKAQLKQSALDAARSAVEEFAAQVSDLKSQHLLCSDNREWLSLASSFPPPSPPHWRRAESAARRARSLLAPLGVPESELPAMESACANDASEFERARGLHREELAEQRTTSQLANRVLTCDLHAWEQVLREQPLIPAMPEPQRIEFKVHSAHLVECTLFARGSDVIPSEILSLTSTGKLSSKAMPRTQFMELYQDFICSAVLRLAREVHALLDVSAVLVNVLSGDDGAATREPVLSVVFERQSLQRLRFDVIDPSDAVETFPCRTEFKASRRDGAFKAIKPFEPSDVSPPISGSSITELMRQAAVLLDELE